MKKKGFTLIELLAVIVILAIIALIATPLVLKYIEKSRKESKVDSAYSYVRNLETEIANYSIKNNGKKYNKSGLVEIGELTDIDTTVKGDTPSNGKVCLSSLGQVDKAMFEYGKYYVSYDGKKGSISDKDTYDNFSCSGNNNVDVLFETDVEFICYQPDNCYFSEATVENVSSSINKLKKGYEYDLLIDDVFFTKIFVLLDGDMILASSSYQDKEIGFSKVDSKLEIVAYVNLSGNHNIKITNEQVATDNSLFWVADYGVVDITGLNFVEGQAHVLIEDETGYKYFNGNVDFKSNYLEGIYGTDNGGCRDTLPDIPDLFEAIAGGKKITTTITQVVDGNDIVTTFSGEPIPFGQEASFYYWGQFAYQVDIGC